MIEVVSSGGARHYRDSGLVVPSVSTVLGATGPRRWGLERWRQRLGDAADDVAAVAASRGTLLHQQILRYRATGEAPEEPSPWWESVLPTVRALRQIAELVMAEVPLVHPLAGYGGTPDEVCRIAGRLVVHDWKTSIDPRKPAHLHDYSCQLAAYCDLVELELGERPTSAVVVIGLIGRPAQVVPVRLPEATVHWRERLEDYYASR